MTVIEFKLTMPGRSSWDGGWSGDGGNFTLVREVDDASAAKLDGGSWTYSWPDGWRAHIHARAIPAGSQHEKSDGFRGYDWMAASILRYGTIYADHERPEVTA